MIVRDEEAFLDDCLRGVQGVVDEIVVVDTGSVDRTPEIARSHGARVHFRAWTDSYSEARNAAIDLATGDWILILDADERLDEASKAAIIGAVRDGAHEAYVLSQRNYCSDEGTSDVILNPTCRLWRNRPENRYERRVHEQPTAMRTGRVSRLDAVIHHQGDRPSVIAARGKCARYAALLEAELRDCPDDPSRLHDIAISHYVSGCFDAALPYARRAVEMAEPTSALALLAHSTLIGTLYSLGRLEEAVAAMDRALSLGIGHPEIHYVGGQGLLALDRYEEALAQFERAIELGPTQQWAGDAAVWGYKAHEAAAACCLRLGRCSDAVDHAVAALEAKPDRAETRAVAAEACFRLGDGLYEAGDHSSAAQVYSNALSLAPDRARGFFMLGNCYFRLNAIDAAVLAYRKALEIDPTYADAANNLSVAEEEIARAA